MIRFKSLGSGSAGNATVIEAREGLRRTHVLIDCGLPLRELDRRLAAADLQPEQINAVFITHEHGDHIGSALPFALRQRIPVWMSAGTHAAIGQPDFQGLLRLARDGEAFEVGALQMQPFTVPHDAREPLQLRCTDGAAHLGVLTDLGHVTPYVLQRLAGCGSLLLECNHDAALLAGSRYPAFLKQRIGGAFGHLANEAAAAAAAALRPLGLQQILAAHLSAQNNRPELAQAAVAAAVGGQPDDVRVADAASGSDWLTASP